jgi:hypothetical protein
MAAKFEAIALRAGRRRNILTGLEDTQAELKAWELYCRYCGIEPLETLERHGELPTRVVVSFEEPTDCPTSESPSTDPRPAPSGS